MKDKRACSVALRNKTITLCNNSCSCIFQYFATTLTTLCKVRRVLLRMLQRILIKCAMICRNKEIQLFPKCNLHFGHLTDKHTLNSVSKMQINANLWHKTAAFFLFKKTS